MRPPHYLTANKGSEYPREVIIVDTETRPKRLKGGDIGHVLKFGWAFYARRRDGDEWVEQQWHRFTTRKEFWSWALRKVRSGGRVTMFAHNVTFDGKVMDAFGELRRRRWKIITACLEGPPTIITWRRAKRTLRWLDTLNIWKVPLAVIGKKVGLNKLRMPKSWGSRKRDDRYCRRDVEIVWRALLEWWKFLRDNDLGNFSPTLASQAFTSYRHRFMPAPIFIDANPDALRLARMAYVGGRCECFRLGMVNERNVTLDVNSMYPAIMRTMEAPAKLLTFRTAATMSELARYVREYAVVAHVTLRTEEPAYPLIIKGRLCFPVGEFRQALATPELVYALDHGHVTALHAVAIYEKAQLFRDFMEWGYSARMAARRRGDSLDDWNLRLLINAFYGKWGQRGRQWEFVGTAPDCAVRSLSSWDVDTGRWRNVRQLGTQLQELQDKGEALNSSPAIAAHITSGARLYLWQLIKEAGRELVWYCDTDSIKGAAEIVDRLALYISPDALGSLKVERRDPWVLLNGPKDYQHPDKVRRKGVRAKAESNDGVAFAQEQWEGWAGAIQRGRLDMPVTMDQVKILDGPYLKGTVRPDGYIEPLRLPLREASGRDGALPRPASGRSLSVLSGCGCFRLAAGDERPVGSRSERRYQVTPLRRIDCHCVPPVQ